MDPKIFWNRYRPYLAIVGAIVALVWFLPGDDGDDDTHRAAAVGPARTGGQGATGGAGGPGLTTGTGPGSNGGQQSGGVAGSGGAGGGTGTANEGIVTPDDVGADCDPATGR